MSKALKMGGSHTQKTYRLDGVTALHVTRIAVPAVASGVSAGDSRGNGCEGDSEEGRSANKHCVSGVDDLRLCVL